MQEDESYLNKRGLTHFWENIDALKQDKLTAGANITIASDNTISASQPTVNNATLTIQKEGASVGTFTANASTNSTVNIIETDPTVPAWAKASSKPSYSWTEITNRPTIPTKTSDLTNDSGFLTNTNYATASTGGVVKVGGGLEITNGVLSATGGGTADAVEWANVLNRPTDVSYWTNDAGYITSADLPTVGNATLTIQKNGTSAGTFTANATSNETINITVPTTAADVSALPASTKYGASIAVSINTTDYKVTTTLKDQDGNTLGTAQVIDLPLESVVVNGSYDSTNKKIVLTLQNGSTIDIPVADLVAGLQSEITSTNKLASDLVDDTNQTHKFMTSAEKTKLSGIATGAEVNQNAFSNVKVGSTTVAADTKTDTLELVAGSNVTLTPDATNDKVTIAATDTTYSDATTSAHGLMSAADKTKLNGIAAGAEVNVQSDWSVTDTSSDAFIKNKPTIPTVNNATLTIQKNGTNVQTFTANQGTNATANITVPTKTSDLTNDSGFLDSVAWGDVTGKPTFATVATSGSYNDLSNKPTIPAAQVQSNWTQTTTTAVDYIKNKPSLATVATSGSYNDLSNKPTIPAAQIQSDWTQTTTTALDYIKNKPTLATVATSGSYNDLSNKPTIPTVNNGQLTIQKNGTNVATFTANQSGNSTANISVPTKTSDLTNDGADNTSTYIETDDAQKFAIGQGSTNPVFDDMTPVRTLEWDIATAAYRPIYTIANTGWTYVNMDITIAYRITVTGTNIHQVMDVVDRWHNPVSYPISSVFMRTQSTSAATTGIRYLRSVYPVAAYLNNSTYPLGMEIYPYNATARHIKIEVFKDNSSVNWNTTLASAPIYVSATYNSYNSIETYTNRGWKFRQPLQMYATNAGYASYISDFEAVNVAAGEIKTGATALVAGHYAFLADDGLVYDISNTAKNIAMGESKVGFMNSAVAANTAISWTYWRAISRPNATQLGYINHDTFALGDRAFLRCTMDSSGNIHSDNYLSNTMSAGYTWMPFGWARSATTLYVDTRFPMFYTLDANGKLTHINGKEVAGSEATSVAWNDITGKPTFATVATSGSYNDLTNKPTIPAAVTVDSALSSTSTNPVQNKVINTALSGKQASLSTAQLNAANSGITTAKVATYDGYATSIADLQTEKQDTLTAGDHISISNDTISANGYVHSENPVTTTSSTATVTGSMIATGTITADKLAAGATIKLTLSTTDIGEGAALAANTLYGVYQ